MKLLGRLSRGFEAISYQNNSLLFKELTIQFLKLSEKGNISKDDFKKSDIPNIIFNRTGFKVKLVLDPSQSPNAFVYPPRVDKNNPIINYFLLQLNLVDSKDALKKINKSVQVLRGQIDTKNSKVSGVYSEIEHTMGMTMGLLLSNLFSPEEKASIVLHELGHLFSYYEFLEFNFTTNVTINAAIKEYYNEESLIRRHEIIKETCKILNIDIKDPDTLVEINKKEVLQTILLREAIRENKSSLGSEIYDYVSWEAASDQFATRHGAGRELITALDKISKGSLDPAYRSTLMHVILNGIALLLATMLVLPLIVLLFINPAIKDYDPTKARFERIKREMVAGLKDQNVDKDVKLKISQDIEVINAIINNLDDKRGLFELFHTTIIPSGRRQYNQLQFQKDLENFFNNEMFVAATRFENIKF